jgi:hypothetical protein
MVPNKSSSMKCPWILPILVLFHPQAQQRTTENLANGGPSRPVYSTTEAPRGKVVVLCCPEQKQLQDGHSDDYLVIISTLLLNMLFAAAVVLARLDGTIDAAHL